MLRGPVLPDLRAGGGFTVVLLLSGRRDDVQPGQVILSGLQEVTAALDEEATDETITKGFQVAVAADYVLSMTLTNGFGVSMVWQTTLAEPMTLWDGQRHTVSFIADGGPKVMSAVVDGLLCDGGASHPQGWTFIPRELGEIGGASTRLDRSFAGTVHGFFRYDRALLTSEVIGIHRAEAAEESP